MSVLKGYHGKSFSLLNENKISVGDSIQIDGDISYDGILMPRYENSDDNHIVIKLKNGYNIGVNLEQIKSIKMISPRKEVTTSDEIIQNDTKLPKILLLSTGGTIASKIDYRTGAVTPVLTAAELSHIIPEIKRMASIDAEVLFSEYSENLQPENWKKIAEKIHEFTDSDYEGIIIAHGTDTMQYTASFLSFALSGFTKPIVLVGSQRSSDRPSSDAALNLISAVKFIVDSNTKGIFVCMHNDESDEKVACHIGTRVRKNHTSKRSAFETIGNKPAFLISKDKIENNLKVEIFKNKEYVPRLNYDSKAILLKYHPGFDPKLLDFVIDSGYKAIIFEGTGLGHVGKNLYDSIKKAKEMGIFMGMTSQCIEGKTRMTVYESGRDLLNYGVTPLGDMIPETALVKAMWTTGNFDNVDVKKIMISNISLEIS